MTTPALLVIMSSDHQDIYFQHAHFIPIVGVGKIGAYLLVHGDTKEAPVTETTMRFIGPVPADSRQ